jgi:lipopolysaccharide export LptBFGC system permease protein LptF
VRILHRYILVEMLKALALAVAAVSGVVCVALVLKVLQEEGLGPVASLLYMCLSVPGAIYLAMPLAAILAGTLVYGRMAADNELTACRASGISPASLFWPSILLALFAAAVTLCLAAWPLPESHYAAKRLARSDAEHLFFGMLGSSGKVRWKQAQFDLSVDRVDGDMLHGPMLRRRSKTGQMYCYAPYGQVKFDNAANQARLVVWDAFVLDEQGPRIYGTHVIPLDLPTGVPREERDLSLWHLLAVQRHPEIAEQVRSLTNAKDATIQATIKNVQAHVTGEMHGRLASALGCLGLVLVGAGLGMYFHSGHLLTAFGVALAPWLGATVLTMTAVKAVCRATANPHAAVWMVWLPNVVVVLLGLAILAYLTWFWASPVRLRHLVWRRRG